MIINFIDFINKYCQLLSLEINKTEAAAKRDKLQSEILKLLYGFKGKIRTVREISLLLDVTDQTVRNKKATMLSDLSLILSSEEQKELYGYNKEEIDSLLLEVKKNKVLSIDYFAKLIKEKYDIDFDEYIGPFYLIFDIYNFTVRTPITHYLTDNTFIFTDESVDIKNFMDIAYATYIEVEANVIPIEEDDLIISVKSKLKNASNELIQLACNSLNEIESIDIRGIKYYQIIFHKLSAANDMAYRILFAKGDKMTLSEILKEINHKLIKTPRKRISKVSLNSQMNGDKKLIPLGKSGVWTLEEWGEENLSIFELITNTLTIHNKPLERDFIVNNIRKERPFIPAKSIHSYLYNKDYTQLKDGKYILTEWKTLYKKQLANKKKTQRAERENMVKDQIKQQIANMFNENNLAQINLNVIKNTLHRKYGYPKASIYKCISENNEFVSIETKSNRKIVEMKLSKESKEKPTKSTSVFISYSWDNEIYKEKVISFADFLRKKGFIADLDIKLMQEESAKDFNKLMHEGILKYDKVIVLLSDVYKQKAENFEGGVGKEYSYIIKDIVKNENKYVLASFENINTESISRIAPIEFSSRHIVDLQKDENSSFKVLFSKLTDSKEYIFSDVASETPVIDPKEIKPFTLK
ncbi:hypothetical protein DF185_15645 [Marinifilum breve]|uniref:SEFIR domain-containing protein n=1 Tax=Marinifilum breve TaxID=2184082 RepID=A0A2V3ZVA2_9BACT|nr:SEFIR domain-containing protein [Marinifilum breve]PXX98809.1 hypothetical protein DF185_15645 [Marinifilum breve]